MNSPSSSAVRWIHAGVSLLACFFCALASAASLQISPVSIDIARNANGAAMTLSNPSNMPLYGQLRVFKWDQQQGIDQLSPTQELAASPPIIQIPPGGEQVVRLVRAGGSVEKEACYRILIDEIPDPSSQPRNGVLIRMRYSVPIFVDNGLVQRDRPQLSWTMLRGSDHWRIRVDNSGSLHARLNSVWLIDQKGHRHDIQAGLLGYALPGRHRIWDIDIPAHVDLGNQPVVHATVNSQPSESTARVQIDNTVRPRGQ